MRNDPDPQVLALARAGKFKNAIDLGYRLSTGAAAEPDVFHRAAVAADLVFGDYAAVKIACTSPAADALVEHAKLPRREAELVTDLWLGWWRRGRPGEYERSP